MERGLRPCKGRVLLIFFRLIMGLREEVRNCVRLTGLEERKKRDFDQLTSETCEVIEELELGQK